MRQKFARICFLFLTVFFLSASLVAQQRSPQIVPPEALSKIKQAYAALKQGNPKQARDLAEEVFHKYGDIQMAWFPSWLTRQVKQLPDPYLPSHDLGKIVIGGAEVPLTNLRYAISPVRILFEANWELSRFDETVRWGKMLMQAGERSQDVLRRIEYAEVQLRQGWVYRIVPEPVRSNWRPIPLHFRLEDYFVVVSLDEASKVLGFALKISSNPKFAGGKVVYLSRSEEPAGAWVILLVHPFIYRVEEGKQVAEVIAYAPFEEKGKIWMPFYWLVEKAGLKGWELRGKSIYTSPR